MNSIKKWAPLFATNFLGVMNNIFLRNLVAFVSISLFAQTNKALVVTLASGLYVLPYILFSPLGGRLAKTHKKSNIMFVSKCSELVFFMLAIAGFITHNIYIVLCSVFLIGLISTLFSPSKYGLIRDIGGGEGISFGTGTLEMFTFLGVLIGTFVASLLSDHYNHYALIAILIGFSIMQLISSRMLRKVPEAETVLAENDTLNPIKFLIQSFKWASTIEYSNIIILGLASFWMIGNFILMNLMVHCEKVLHMTNTQTGFVMNISGLGIGIGSLLTGLLSRKKIQLGFTPIGATGMMACFAALFLFKPDGIVFSSLIFLVSFFSGMYMVPLSSWVQHSVEGRLQGSMLAYSNFVIFLLTLISAAIFGPLVSILDTNVVWLVLFFIVMVVSLVLLRNIREMSTKTLALVGIE